MTQDPPTTAEEHLSQIEKMLPVWHKEEALINPTFKRNGLKHKAHAIDFLLEELTQAREENERYREALENVAGAQMATTNEEEPWHIAKQALSDTQQEDE